MKDIYKKLTRIIGLVSIIILIEFQQITPVYALGESGFVIKNKCETPTDDSNSNNNKSDSSGESDNNNPNVHSDVSIDFDENTPAPIGRKNAKKLAQAVAKAGEKLYNIKIDPGLIYGQWVKESGPDLNANPPLNNEAHNLGGLSGTPPAWLAKQGVTTGSKHAEDSGIYMNFPNYKLYGEAYISGYIPSVPLALKAINYTGGKVTSEQMSKYVNVLHEHGYFTDTNIAGYISGVQAGYAIDPNSENLDKAITSVKTLRDAMQANGATPEELAPLDDQISKLQALRDTNPINPQERLGFDGVQNIEDAITEPDVISGIPDGYKLRDNAVNDLHEFDKNPNDKTAKQAISSIKALRDANVENGGSAETISKLNTQIDSLEQARQPVLDIDSKISELDDTSLSDTAKEQLQNELSKLQDQPDSADYQGIKNLVSNAEALVTDPQSKNILSGIKNTVKQAELSSIGSNISNMLADTGIVDKPDIQDLTGSMTDYQLHPTDDNLSKLQDKMVGMRDKAYLANNPKIANAVNGQFSKLNDIGLSQQTQKVSLDLTSNLNSDDFRDITNSLNNYTVNPSAETFRQLEKSMTDKINSLDNSGQGDLSKVVRDNLTNLQNINAQHINSNFGNNLRQALGNARNNESIIKLLNKVDLAKTTPEKLNVTKEITASVQKQGLENDIDSKKLAESIRLIQVNQVK